MRTFSTKFSIPSRDDWFPSAMQFFALAAHQLVPMTWSRSQGHTKNLFSCAWKKSQGTPAQTLRRRRHQVRDIKSTIHGPAKSSSSQSITATIRPCHLSSRWVRSQISRESTASNGFTRSRRFSCSATLQDKSDFPRPAPMAASRLSASRTESVALGPLVLAAAIQRACGRWLKPSWYPDPRKPIWRLPPCAVHCVLQLTYPLVNGAPACSGRNRRSAMSAS